VWESASSFIWKNAKNYVFRRRPSLGKNSKFELLGWLNEFRGAVFVIILWMWISRQSRLTINFIAPSVGKCFNFYLKNAETTFFAQNLYLGKNDRFDLLGWLWVLGPFFDRHNLDVDFKAMKSPHYLFLIVFGKYFPVVFNDETLFFENRVVWCRRLCHNDSGIWLASPTEQAIWWTSLNAGAHHT